MEAYAERFELSQVISSFRRLVPHANRENDFKIQEEDDAKALFDSGYPAMLDGNRKKRGEEFSFYKSMGKFPHRATER